MLATTEASSRQTRNGTGKTSIDKGGLTTELIIVTPEIARAWLDKNAKNRKVAAGTVQSYARDMKNKKWVLTGDAIRFDTNGNLIDGQHRLLACIEAERGFPTLVIYKINPEAQDQIDSGKARKASDMLTLQGFHNTVRLAAVARIIYATKNDASNSRVCKLTKSEIKDIVKKHPGLHRSVSIVEGAVGAPPAMLAYIHYVAACLLDKEKRANAFVEVFKTGIPDYEGDPAQKLRERILRQKTAREAVRREVLVGLMQHSWNLFAKRKPSDVLRPPKDVSIDGLDLGAL